MMHWNPFVRAPKQSLIVLAVALLPLLWQLQQVQVRSDADALLESNPSQKATLEKVTSVFQDQVILIVDLECDDIFSADGIEALGKVSDALMTIDGVEDVKSLTHSFKPVRKGFSFDMVPLVDRQTTDADELERLRKYCLENPLIRNVMVSPDSRHATLVVTFEGSFDTLASKRLLREQIQTLFRDFKKRKLAFEVIGLPLVEEEVYSTIVSDLTRFLPLVILFLLATLGIAFRSAWFVGFMLMNQVVALVMIAGTLQLFGYPFTVFTLLLFPLWAGIHLTLLVHLGTACQRMLARGARDVVGEAVRHVLKSCGFATLTTLAGLLSLGLAAIPQVREAGLVGAYGVGVVFLMTFGPGVAMLSLYYESNHGLAGWAEGASKEVVSKDKSLAWLRQLQSWRPLVFFGSVVLVALTLYEVPQLRMGVRPIEFLPKDSPSRSAGERFNTSYGGFNMFQLRVDSGVTNGVNQVPFLRYLEGLQNYAESQEGVSGAYSYAQVLAMMNQIWEQEREGSLTIPTNPLLLGTFSLVLRTQRFPFFEALCDAEYQTANVVVRSPDLPSDKYLGMLEKVLDYAEANRPEGVTLSAEQGLHSILEADQQLVGSQLRSAVTALVVILVLLIVLWRSVSLALLAVFVNALPVGAVIILAAGMDIPLNSITVMIAAIAFGIAIDDTVHFVTQWRESQGEGLTGREALARAIQIKARPMIYSSLVLGGIFALLVTTSFPPVKHFGGLSAVAFALALAAVFVVLPAALVRPEPKD